MHRQRRMNAVKCFDKVRAGHGAVRCGAVIKSRAGCFNTSSAAHQNPDFKKNQVSRAENRRWPRADSAVTLDSFFSVTARRAAHQAQNAPAALRLGLRRDPTKATAQKLVRFVVQATTSWCLIRAGGRIRQRDNETIEGFEAMVEAAAVSAESGPYGRPRKARFTNGCSSA
jgi:hypothetical protein